MSARGANVYAVCSPDSHVLVSSLGALECRDYANPNHLYDLENRFKKKTKNKFSFFILYFCKIR